MKVKILNLRLLCILAIVILFRIAVVEITNPAFAKSTVVDCPSGMAHIPSGEFLMGCSPSDKECTDEEKPAKQVRISNGFCVDKYEVTQGEYMKVLGDNPGTTNNTDPNFPVSVSWIGAKKFCQLTGKRLPSEAEWVYAVRGNQTAKYYWGNKVNGKYVWYSKNSNKTPHLVGKKKPNKNGLYDTLGNLSEWVEDCYEWNWLSKMPVDDPINDNQECYGRVVKGGSWDGDEWGLRISARSFNNPYDETGFRCVLEIDSLNTTSKIKHGNEFKFKRTELDKSGTCPEKMVFIPAGKFSRVCGRKECEVEITQGFCLSKYEVTQKEFKNIIGENPSKMKECGDKCPVENVPWIYAKSYCEKLGFRLPTEAEWEYAARGGTNTKYYWGDSMDGSYEWYSDNSQVKYTSPSRSINGEMKGTHQVGQKKPNQYGLHDMLGNVKEWVFDCNDGGWDNNTPIIDPVNDKSLCNNRVVKGGSWAKAARDLTVSVRDMGFSFWHFNEYGFRCAKDVMQ